METGEKTLQDIISGGESQIVEFKEMSSGVSPKPLAQSMVAFANADGGDIYIGITDNGEALGIRAGTASLDHILNAARELCTPSIEITLHTIPVNQKKIIHIHVDRSPALHSLSNGMIYVRVGSQDKRITGEDIARLATAKSIVSFEDHLIEEARMADLDAGLIRELQNSPINAERMKNFSPENVLRSYQLSQKGGLSAAAILLFAKEPTRWLFDSGATFVQFSGESSASGSITSEMGYVDREDINLPLVPMINRLAEKVTMAIRKGGRITNTKRIEEWEYPPNVFRECIVNALAHRDWRISGARVDVFLYSDHLEVRSPGALPGFMTIETLGTRHYPRNPKLMRCLLDWGYVESLGLGIANIKKTLFTLGFPPPEWTNYPDEFRVSIWKRPIKDSAIRQWEKLAPAEQKTMAYIYEHGSINRKEYIKLHNVSVSRAKVELRSLTDKKIIKLEGSGPSSQYVLRS